MHTELGIKVVDGEPGTLDDAVAELHGISRVLDRTAGSLSGSAQPPGWQGNASMS